MWPFVTGKSIEKSGLLNGLTDWHSHILPGVDDGIETMDDSIAVLREFERLGVRKVWLTPHIMEDYPNTTAELRGRFEELRRNWTGGVEIRLASENMLDTLFEERLEADDFLPIGDDGNHLLVETSYYTPPFAMDDLIEKVHEKGYHVVLAHPERYRYMDEADYRRLKDVNVKFQVNYMSLVGGYGETARKKGDWLLRKGIVDFIGSDIHDREVFLEAISRSVRKDSLNSLMSLR